MKKGSIKLIEHGRSIHQVHYDGRYHRNMVLDNWRKLYNQERFDRMFIQVTPDVFLDDRKIKREVFLAHENPIPEEFLINNSVAKKDVKLP